MRKSGIVLAVGLALIAGVVAYFLLSPSGADLLRSKKVITDAKVINKTAVGYVGNPYKDDYQMSRVTGYVDNLGKQELARVVFEIRLIDSDGNRKERVKYVVTDVPARSRKSFDANAGAISGARNAEAKIVEIEVVQ